MRLVEGLSASYVGPESGGVRTGDRCLVLSDEQSVMHVRWTTGAKTGQYGEVRPNQIVADIGPDSDDEWGFEAGHAAGKVGINIEALYDRGGEIALFEALETEGHLDNLRLAAAEAVRVVRTSLNNDESWDAVRAALGADASDVERSAIIAAVTAAVEGEDVLESTETGDADGYID